MINAIGLRTLLAVVVLLNLAITGMAVLNPQGSPSITSFTATIRDSNNDGSITASDLFSFSCSASDPNGLKYMSVNQTYPTGGSGTWSPSTPNGYLDSPINYTFAKNDVGTVLWTSGGKEGGVAGTYTFQCEATNVNGTKVRSEIKSITIQNCNPSVEGSCRNEEDCKTGSGKWCMGGTYLNSYCDIAVATCTDNFGSACGNGKCDKGEYFQNQQYQGSNMCPKDCGGQVSSCNVDPYKYKNESACKSVGCLWCSAENVCKTGSSCSSSVYMPQCNENGKCDRDIGESEISCSVDCGVSDGYKNGCGPGTGGYCGDGLCNINCNVQEDYGNCYKDCAKTSQIESPLPSLLPEQRLCGGIDSIACPDGYECIYENQKSTPSSPDATGVCAQPTLPDVSLVNVLLEKPFILPEKITTTSLNEFNIPDEVEALSGLTKLSIEAVKDVEANTAMQITIFDNIPAVDDKNRKLKVLPSVGQLPIKVIQFALPAELSEAVRKATIDFMLTEKELNDISPEDIRMLRFADGRWIELPTTYIGQEGSNHIFTSISPGFSVFVITKKSSAVASSPSPIIGCSQDSDCSWQSANGCSEQSGAMWKCKAEGTPLQEYNGKSCSNLYVSKPKADTCGCIEGSDGNKKCAPVEAKSGEGKTLLKSSLLDTVITLEDFKTRFDYLAKGAKKIADYYLSINRPQDYTTWLKTSQSFVTGVFRLDSVKRYVKLIKDRPTEADIEIINKEINDILNILDSSTNFLLKDVLDIGSLSKEQTIALAVGQSVVFGLDGQNHTLTVKSIENGKAKFLISSYPTTISLSPAEEEKLSLSDASTLPDTSIKVETIEKNIVYVKLNSALSETFAVAGEVACQEIVGDTTMEISEVQTCYNIKVDNVTFDGAGQKIDGSGLGYGFLVSGRKGITIKNLVLENFINGIKLVNTKGSTITNVNISSVAKGIELVNSADNVISENVLQIGKSLSQTATGKVNLEDLVTLNEVLLYDGSDVGTYVPFLSITSNTRSQYNDLNGNPIESTDFTINTEDLNSKGQSAPFIAKISLKKGQSALVDSGAIVSPDSKGDANIRITVSAQGYKDQIVQKKINVDSGL